MRKLLLVIVLVAAIASGVVYWQLELRDDTGFTSQQTTRPNPTPTTQLPQPQTKQEPAFDATKHKTDTAGSIWWVVNKTRPLEPSSYAPDDLVSVGNGQLLRKEPAEALQRMFAAAKNAGIILSADSGYRSYATQTTVYANEVKTNGQEVADTQSARPGYSEHQTGLAIDIGSGGCNIEDCVADTPGGKWLAAHAHEYGFILRYPVGKTAITGYRAEAWHYRYVGSELATEMRRTGVNTLEEFFDLPAAPSYVP